MRELLEQLSESGRCRALTHSSWAATPGDSFERLEFLGDSVLGLAIANDLFARFPDEPEGVLSKLKASIVSRDACAIVAREMGLGEAMIAAAPARADRALVRDLAAKDRVLAALTESVIGVAFLELGYDVVAAAVVRAFAARSEHALTNSIDAKSALQELLQQRGDSVEYEAISVAGPDHAREFTMRARLASGEADATGVGSTKKSAEQLAARELLDHLRGHA